MMRQRQTNPWSSLTSASSAAASPAASPASTRSHRHVEARSRNREASSRRRAARHRPLLSREILHLRGGSSVGCGLIVLLVVQCT